MNDLSVCPGCGGEADNGHDRCDPPRAYLCSKCSSPYSIGESVDCLSPTLGADLEDDCDDTGSYRMQASTTTTMPFIFNNPEAERRAKRAELVREFMAAALPANILYKTFDGSCLTEEQVAEYSLSDAVRAADAYLKWESEQ